jgi:phosphoglycerate dehydrogenase-like enzyme
LDQAARPDVLNSGLIITGSAGRSARALAQHAFYFALALTYRARALLADQDARVWRGIPGYGQTLGLPGKTLGIVGLGNTGVEMAKLGRVFGMTVMAYGRSTPSAAQLSQVDCFLCSDRGETIGPVLDQADVIMLAAPLNDATWHMFSTDEFRRMKPSAFIVNMARGGLIDESALLAALQAGELAGAGLDVFETEPLPVNSPLWDAPNLMLTPHVTPAQPDKIERSVDVIVANAALYRAGQTMVNRLTVKDIYTPRRDRE